MSERFVQSHPLKGSQKFEFTDDGIKVFIKKPLSKEKEKFVTWTILNPEPVENGSILEFYGRVRCSPLISLYKNKPNQAEYEAFVKELIKHAEDEYNRFLGK